MSKYLPCTACLRIHSKVQDLPPSSRTLRARFGPDGVHTLRPCRVRERSVLAARNAEIGNKILRWNTSNRRTLPCCHSTDGINYLWTSFCRQSGNNTSEIHGFLTVLLIILPQPIFPVFTKKFFKRTIYCEYCTEKILTLRPFYVNFLLGLLWNCNCGDSRREVRLLYGWTEESGYYGRKL